MSLDSNTEWKHVRHIPESDSVCWWEPSKDLLKGTEVYGDPTNDTRPWSTKFEL